MKHKSNYRIKVKILYPEDYKDEEHYKQALENWEEKGYYQEVETMSTKEGENWTILVNDGYKHFG